MVVGAVLGLALSACGGGGGGLASGEDYTVLGALAELPPAPEGPFWVETGDLRAASELAAHPRPESLDPDEVARWVSVLHGGPQPGEGREMHYLPIHAPTPTVTHPTWVYGVQEFHDAAGWSVLDVDAFVEVQVDATTSLAVLFGDFDDANLERLPEVADGVRSVGEGVDGEADPGGHALDRAGRPVRMAHDDGKLAVSFETDTVSDWLGGREQTLADHEGVAALATALDDAGVVAATLRVGGRYTVQDRHPLTESGDPDAETDLAEIEERLDVLPEHPFDAAAVGRTVEDGEAVLFAAYYFGDEEAAAASVEPLEMVFTEGSSLTGTQLTELFELVEIAAEGPVVTATLRALHPQAPHQLPMTLMHADVPFLHQ